MAPTFTGGALSFKGQSSKKKKKKKSKHSIKSKEQQKAMVPVDDDTNHDTTLTDAERKAQRRRKEREEIELRKAAGKSHRERVEEFNEKLASQTELNDIPRVSAAGNG